MVRVFTAGTSPVTGPSLLTYDEFSSLGKASAFRASVAFITGTRVMTGAGMDPVHVVVARTAGDLVATLGAAPQPGRGFSLEEMTAGSPVVLLGHELWSRRFSADPKVIGRTVALDGAPHTVVGVVPAGRGYPVEAELWRPLTASERSDNDRELNMLARLRSGTNVGQASGELAVWAQGASNRARTAWADDLQRTQVSHVSKALQALFWAAMLTLVIACVNVAALVGARGGERSRELTMRRAIGATRGRLFRQLLVECIVLALVGGALGLLVGRFGLNLLVAMAPASIPRLSEASLDSRIIGLGLLATLLTGLAVGLTTALPLSRLTGTFGIGAITGGRITLRSGGRRVLVLAQVAIAVVLATGAGLLARSLVHLVSINHGFAPDQLVAVDLYLRGVFEGDARQLFRQLIAQSETLPGVRSAAVSMRLPTQVTGLRTRVRLAGEPELASPATLRPVSPAYFDTVGLRVSSGRAFSTADTEHAPRVAIVNTAFVRDIVGGRPMLGAQLTTSLLAAPVLVVGVVADVTPAAQPDRAALYVPVDQVAIGGGYLVVRATGDPRSIIPGLVGRLRQAAPGIPADRVHRVAEALEESRAVSRFSAQVAGAFAGLALLLSVVGVYGLTANDVSMRWHELAVRLALGAPRRDVLWTVIRPCAAVLAAGAALGMLGSLSVGPSLASLLHGVEPADEATLGTAPLLLGVAGMLAALAAAWRVLQADPATSLRCE